MKTYKGDVRITEENAAEWREKLKGVKKINGSVAVYGSATFPALTEVGGYVAVYGSATFPALTEVGGYVDVYGSAKADFPALTEVGGYVDVYGSATFPALTEVGGSVAVSGSAECQMPSKEKIGKNPKPLRPISEKFASKGYLFADNILSRIVSKRKSGNAIIYKTICIGNRKKIMYVAQRGALYAHGDTPKQAIHDLRYKLAERDTTPYKKWTLDSVHPTTEVIRAYRAITGACETGTKQFCEGRQLPAKVSIKVAVRLTRGQYGADKFAAFFAKEAK